MATMHVTCIHSSGGAAVLKLEDLLVPEARDLEFDPIASEHVRGKVVLRVAA